MSVKTKMRQRTCDNCAQMTLLLCGDGLMHRHCDQMNLFIADWNQLAFCANHAWLTIRKGGRQ